jgi:potassium/hydrogen antiporter
MELTNQIIFLAGLLVLFSVIAGAITPRIGMPLLLVFLLIGMLAGEDGPGGLVFDDVGLAFLAGSLALAVILFDGGLRTEMKLFRVGLKPALSLASVGVVLTAAITGLACVWVFDLHWMEALLLGGNRRVHGCRSGVRAADRSWRSAQRARLRDAGNRVRHQ